ncbi:cupin-like domain-containing protein [Scheffersomyces amazonensis]|uniref:cupin-like domain-containing protein n=1 Tax=Scheffersomyces amazonensis TaxID=1078765 RepID=UPI00315D7EE7
MSRPTKLQTTLSTQYKNFKIESQDETIDELVYESNTDINDLIDPEEFFAQYIAPRKPVKFVDYPLIGADGSRFDFEKFNSENILKTLNYDEDLQIEKKFQEGFGSGQPRVKFGLSKLIQLFKDGHDEYYLTTQYDFDDPDNIKEQDGEVKEEDDDEEEDDGDEQENDDEEDVDEDSEKINDEESDDKNEETKGVHIDVKFNADEEDFSDTSSIDMNDLHDDFVDSDEDSEEDNDVILDKELGITQTEVDQRIRELLQPPLTNLVKHPSILSIRPRIFSKLIPQQINLWVGASSSKTVSANEITLDLQDSATLGLGKSIPGEKRGTSSGLHHDHADNLYVLVSGMKRFTLFSPADASKLYTIGNIFKVFNSGIIDYVVNEFASDWKHIRDDGALVEEIIDRKLETSKGSEKVKLITELKALIKERNNVKKPSARLDPPNFSKIPPALLHIDEFPNEDTRAQLISFANEYFPGFLSLNKYEVSLTPGDMLYLPAGWFHEVSSFGESSSNDKSNIHIALNYWFMPPTTSSFEQCYEDDYWPEDWFRTEKCIQLCN